MSWSELEKQTASIVPLSTRRWYSGGPGETLLSNDGGFSPDVASHTSNLCSALLEAFAAAAVAMALGLQATDDRLQSSVDGCCCIGT